MIHNTDKTLQSGTCDDNRLRLVVDCAGARVGGGAATNKQHIHEYMVTMI